MACDRHFCILLLIEVPSILSQFAIKINRGLSKPTLRGWAEGVRSKGQGISSLIPIQTWHLIKSTTGYRPTRDLPETYQGTKRWALLIPPWAHYPITSSMQEDPLLLFWEAAMHIGCSDTTTQSIWTLELIIPAESTSHHRWEWL